MSVVTCITHFCSSPVRDFIYLPEPRGRTTPLQLSFPFLLRLPFSPPARYLRFGIKLLLLRYKVLILSSLIHTSCLCAIYCQKPSPSPPSSLSQPPPPLSTLHSSVTINFIFIFKKNNDNNLLVYL